MCIRLLAEVSMDREEAKRLSPSLHLVLQGLKVRDKSRLSKGRDTGCMDSVDAACAEGVITLLAVNTCSTLLPQKQERLSAFLHWCLQG